MHAMAIVVDVMAVIRQIGFVRLRPGILGRGARGNGRCNNGHCGNKEDCDNALRRAGVRFQLHGN